MTQQPQQRETLTVTDLTRVFFRAQGKDGRWKSVDALEASDKAFDTWARSRMPIQGEGEWSLEERAAFCDILWQHDALVLLKKGVTFEDDEDSVREAVDHT